MKELAKSFAVLCLTMTGLILIIGLTQLPETKKESIRKSIVNTLTF